MLIRLVVVGDAGCAPLIARFAQHLSLERERAASQIEALTHPRSTIYMVGGGASRPPEDAPGELETELVDGELGAWRRVFAPTNNDYDDEDDDGSSHA